MTGQEHRLLRRLTDLSWHVAGGLELRPADNLDGQAADPERLAAMLRWLERQAPAVTNADGPPPRLSYWRSTPDGAEDTQIAWEELPDHPEAVLDTLATIALEAAIAKRELDAALWQFARLSRYAPELVGDLPDPVQQ
ncbi:hypothetical protein [Cryptosporangium phraense]|uniref:Uncharacterized protein n=1 Tax=Cryptosporangium phraense TaxID=2593070 RepID=A0A545ASP3_9ACTN|nr:hypothetical protein [Cryptosporangium phraense]TQS44354.1 hypothetical protein FL583_15590 [Cryptosporangium phraense]